VSCFLEFLYTGEYFPKKIPGTRTLETDPSLPSIDDTGDMLLKHARVYTLAEKFEMRALRILSSSKVHCVNATVKGEIVFARYAYAFTRKDDTTVRAPIASFWAMRSHTLRAEAEDEFKALCLEFPQFGYDVLSKFLPRSLYHPSCRQEVHNSAGKLLDPFFSLLRFANMVAYSPRAGRQTQEGENRQDASRDGGWSQACAPQQRQRCLSAESRFVDTAVLRLSCAVVRYR
jgi:hypothetical protein